MSTEEAPPTSPGRALLGRLRSLFGQRKGAARRFLGSRAYNLVVLAVAVTLLNVWVAATLPLWSHQIQRDKEAELIFRGMQYAEAIRIFQQRYNRYPTNLKELIEVEPRCIRQLWENPMREDGRWGLIPVGVGGEVGRGGGNQNQDGGLQATGGRGNADGRGGAAGEDDFDDGFGDGAGDGFGDDPFGEGEDQDAGVVLSADPDDIFGEAPSNIAIRGVFSPTSMESIHVFLGKENVREWQFTLELVSSQKQGLPDNPSLVTPFLAWEIGRPWPPGITPQTPQPSSEPQQQKPQGRDLGGGTPVNDQGNPVIGIGGGQAAGQDGRPPVGGGRPQPNPGGGDGRN